MADVDLLGYTAIHWSWKLQDGIYRVNLAAAAMHLGQSLQLWVGKQLGLCINNGSESTR